MGLSYPPSLKLSNRAASRTFRRKRGTKSSNAVVHEDAHYIKLLESLNGTILSSVAKAFKSSCKQDLSEEAGNKILKCGRTRRRTLHQTSRVLKWDYPILRR